LFKGIAYVALSSCVIGTCLLFGGPADPVCGQAVPDETAAQARGGCNYFTDVTCPNPGGAGCNTCTKLDGTGHNQYGTGAGNCYCSTGCGSFFSTWTKCAGG